MQFTKVLFEGKTFRRAFLKFQMFLNNSSRFQIPERPFGPLIKLCWLLPFTFFFRLIHRNKQINYTLKFMSTNFSFPLTNVYDFPWRNSLLHKKLKLLSKEQFHCQEEKQNHCHNHVILKYFIILNTISFIRMRAQQHIEPQLAPKYHSTIIQYEKKIFMG